MQYNQTFMKTSSYQLHLVNNFNSVKQKRGRNFYQTSYKKAFKYATNLKAVMKF